MKKPSIEERTKIAEELKPYNGEGNIQDETLRLVKECVEKMGISAKPRLCEFSKVEPYDKMPKDKDRELTSLIFIQFTKDGYIAVVGAGEDINFNFSSYKGTTGKILKELNHEWYEKSLIMVTVNNLKAVAASKVKNVFESRNGVEHYIGEYLCKNKSMPILNEWSHRNFTEDGWNRISPLKID